MKRKIWGWKKVGKNSAFDGNEWIENKIYEWLIKSKSLRKEGREESEKISKYRFEQTVIIVDV